MSEKLLLGIAREDITPQIGCQLFGYFPDVYSESINDNLYVTAFVFTYGDTRVVFESVNICSINNEIQHKIREEISAKLDIPFDNIILAATHTHSGPNAAGMVGWGDMDEDYTIGCFKTALVKAAVDAASNQQEVLVATAVGNSNVGINRRQLTAKNGVALGQNPWGPFDPKMTVISFKTLQGEVLGNIIAYGCHGTSAGVNHEITRDWSGIMTDAIETVSGGITAFFNGAEGDVGPRLSNGGTTGNITLTKELGAIAARDALQIYNSITEYKEVSVSVYANPIKLPLLPRIPLEEAERNFALYKGKSLTNIDKKRADYFEQVIASYADDFKEEEYREIPQTILRIGEVAFVTSPYELFSEINMRIDRMVDDLNVIVLSNTNGIGGYFPTQDQICRGGYEVLSFLYDAVQCYTEDADYQLIKEIYKNIQNLKR